MNIRLPLFFYDVVGTKLMSHFCASALPMDLKLITDCDRGCRLSLGCVVKSDSLLSLAVYL